MEPIEKHESEAGEPHAQLNRFWRFLLKRYGPDDTINLPDEKLEWEVEKHLSLYKDYSDFGIKAVGIFAATVGGVLSISFGGGADPAVKWFLLQAAFIMSLVMGFIFIGCGALWFHTSIKVKWIARKLKMIKSPDIVYLSYLLWIFGILFLVVAGGLDWLKSRVL
jgi:hypothetical protein